MKPDIMFPMLPVLKLALRPEKKLPLRKFCHQFPALAGKR